MLATSTVNGVPQDMLNSVVVEEGNGGQVQLSTEEMVDFYAESYGANAVSMLATLQCESELKHDAHGDNGLAYGIAQFHEETFNWFKVEAGMPELDYRSKENQIELMAWAFANDYAPHWSCWRKYKAKQLAMM